MLQSFTRDEACQSDSAESSMACDFNFVRFLVRDLQADQQACWLDWKEVDGPGVKNYESIGATEWLCKTVFTKDAAKDFEIDSDRLVLLL